MDLVNYEEKRNNDIVVEKFAEFQTIITNEVNTLEDIQNKFINYRFDEHINNFREEFNCQSKSDIKYYLYISYEGEGLFFGIFLRAYLYIANRSEIEFHPTQLEDERINNILANSLYDEVSVDARMEISFLRFRSLDALDEYEREQLEDLRDDGEDDEEVSEQTPAIIESCFLSDNCTICLSFFPNILFFPCLHLAVCEKCEETGKLLKCSVCRETIERKVKI